MSNLVSSLIWAMPLGPPPVPTFTSLNFDVVDPNSLAALVVTGTGFAGGALTIDGISEPSAIFTSTTCSFTWPTGKAIGNRTCTITTSGGSVNFTVEVFDELELDLELALRSYNAAGTWTGLASNGYSALRPLVQATGANQPTVGSPYNGQFPAVFDGTTDYFIAPGFWSDYAGQHSGIESTGWCLVNPTSLVADPGAGVRNTAPAIMSDIGGGILSINIHAGGASICGWDGAQKEATATGLAAGTEQIIWWRVTQKSISIRIGTGAWVTAGWIPTSSQPSLETRTIHVGRNFGSVYLAATLRALSISGRSQTDDVLFKILGCMAGRYNMSTLYSASAPVLDGWSLDGDVVDVLGGVAVATGRGLANITTVNHDGAPVSFTKTSTSLSITVPAKTAGVYNVQAIGPNGSSNTITLRSWTFQTDADTTLVFDTVHTGYSPALDWQPRHANPSANVGLSNALKNNPVGTGPHLAVDGVPQFDGNLAVEAGLRSSSLSRTWSDYLSAPGSGYRAGGILVIADGPMERLLDTSLGYSSPNIIGAMDPASGTLGVAAGSGAGALGIPGMGAHIYADAYKNLNVPCRKSVPHMAVSRWPAAAGNFDLSVDGGLAGSGLYKSMAIPYGSYDAFLSTNIFAACYYDASTDTRQNVTSDLRAFAVLKVPPSDTFIERARGLGVTRFGLGKYKSPQTLRSAAWFKDYPDDALSGGWRSRSNNRTMNGTATRGALVNGRYPISFNGTSHNLNEPTLPLSDYYGTNTHYVSMFVKVTSTLSAFAAQVYDDKQLCGDHNGSTGIAVGLNSGVASVRGWFSRAVGGGYAVTNILPLTLNVWHHVEWWATGTQHLIAVDGVAASPVAETSGIASLGAVYMRIARNYNANYTAMELLDFIPGKIVPTTRKRAELRDTYALSEYGATFFSAPPLPSITSVDGDAQADSAGGDVLVVNVADLGAGALSATWNGIACTGLSSNTGTGKVTMTLPAATVGAARNVVVTTAAGSSAGFPIESFAPSDATSATCTSFLEKPSYTGGATGTWTARVGPNFAQPTATNVPTAVAGEPDFDGTNDFLNGVSSTTAFGFAGATGGGTMFVGTKQDTAKPQNASVVNVYDPGIVGHFSGGVMVGMSYSDYQYQPTYQPAAVGAFIYDSTPGYRDVSCKATLGVLHAVLMRAQANDFLQLQVDGKNNAGAAGWESLAVLSINAFAAPLGLGANYSTVYTDGTTRFAVFFSAKISDAEAVKLNKWARRRHGTP